jgi:hypothetical protein
MKISVNKTKLAIFKCKTLNQPKNHVYFKWKMEEKKQQAASG